MPADCQNASEQCNIHHYRICSGWQQPVECITCGFKYGKSCSHACTQQQSVQNILGVCFPHIISYHHNFSGLFHKADQHRSPVGKISRSRNIIQDQRADQRQNSADKKHRNHAEYTDISRGINFPEKDQQCKRNRHRSHKNEARIGIWIMKLNQNKIQNKTGNGQKQKYSGIQPWFWPCRCDFWFFRCCFLCSGNEKLFCLFHRMLFKHLRYQIRQMHLHRSTFTDFFIQSACHFVKTTLHIICSAYVTVYSPTVSFFCRHKISAAVAAESCTRLQGCPAKQAEFSFLPGLCFLLCSAFGTKLCLIT